MNAWRNEFFFFFFRIPSRFVQVVLKYGTQTGLDDILRTDGSSDDKGRLMKLTIFTKDGKEFNTKLNSCALSGIFSLCFVGVPT